MKDYQLILKVQELAHGWKPVPMFQKLTLRIPLECSLNPEDSW